MLILSMHDRGKKWPNAYNHIMEDKLATKPPPPKKKKKGRATTNVGTLAQATRVSRAWMVEATVIGQPFQVTFGHHQQSRPAISQPFSSSVSVHPCRPWLTIVVSAGPFASLQCLEAPGQHSPNGVPCLCPTLFLGQVAKTEVNEKACHRSLSHGHTGAPGPTVNGLASSSGSLQSASMTLDA